MLASKIYAESVPACKEVAVGKLAIDCLLGAQSRACAMCDDAVSLDYRLKLQLPGSSATSADAPRPQLSTAVIAAAVLALAVAASWARLQHS